MTNQKTMTIAEYQLRRAELNGCEVHHRGYRVVSVTLTTLDGQSPEYWLETEGGCGSFAGTEIVTITQRNTLNSGKNTGELFETISEGLVRGESNGNFGVSEGLLNPEDIDCSEALAALATLRQSHDYDISQHISGALGDLFDDEGLFVETTPSIELVDRMVKEIKTLRQRVADLEEALYPFAQVASFPIFRAPITDGKRRLTPADFNRAIELSNGT